MVQRCCRQSLSAFEPALLLPYLCTVWGVGLVLFFSSMLCRCLLWSQASSLGFSEGGASVSCCTNFECVAMGSFLFLLEFFKICGFIVFVTFGGLRPLFLWIPWPWESSYMYNGFLSTVQQLTRLCSFS